MNSDNDMYNFYFYAGFPMILALFIIMLLFRPLYIISATRYYAMYTRDAGIKLNLPENSPKYAVVLTVFVVFAILMTCTYLYRDELGITAYLSQ